MSLLALQGSFELGLLYCLVAMGLFISYRVLGIADLTVDGSFTLGACVSAVFTVIGHPLLGIILAILAGALAGSFTALLQTKFKVPPILAGIVTMTGLYSINLRVMGKKPNISILGKDSLFTMTSGVFSEQYYKLITPLIIVAAVVIFFIFFLKTPLGLSIRATGDNPDMVSSSSINPDFTKTIGLSMANGIVALSGALLAQYQQFSDMSMGIGMVIIGLASLIIGEVIIGQSSIPRNIIAVVVGSIIYRIIIAFALKSAISPSDLKLVSALIVGLAISFPAIKENYKLYRLRKAGDKHA